MDQKAQTQAAVLTLLESSVLFTYEQKLAIMDVFPSFNEEQLTALGNILSQEEIIKEDYAPEIEKGVEDVLLQVISPDEEEDRTVYVGSSRGNSTGNQ